MYTGSVNSHGAKYDDNNIPVLSVNQKYKIDNAYTEIIQTGFVNVDISKYDNTAMNIHVA